MLRITWNKDYLVIKKPDNHFLQFILSDKKLFKVIKLNIEKISGGKNECNFRLEKLSDKEIYLILNGYKLLINEIIANNCVTSSWAAVIYSQYFFRYEQTN